MISGSQKTKNALFIGVMVSVTALAIFTVGSPALFPSESDIRRRREMAQYHLERDRVRELEREKEREKRDRDQ
ncbi:hypothetical protein HDU77_001696 [Chytriomyces hyalinus]|nr:hypothetical protein HDU77_001696 [Chytriomyces hyalinus]